MRVQLEWEKALRERGHEPQLMEGQHGPELDYMAYSVGIHNGPRCHRCGEHWCWHCSTTKDIGQCVRDFVEGEKR